MISEPTIVQSPALRTAVIHLTIPRADIRTEMGPGVSELMSTVASQGLTPDGPWFTHHLRMDPEVFDFEIGVAVDSPVTPQGRVKPGELPAGTLARAVYQGPFEGLGSAWTELDAWVAAEGHTPGGDLWERYLTGPEANPDPASWRTELNRPLTRTA